MKKSAKQSQPKPQPVKKITIAEAFKMWMGGKGRSELEEQTGHTRGELRKAFVKSSGKSWSQLNVESGRVKPKKAAAKEGRQQRRAA